MGGMMGGNEPRQFGYMDGDRKVSALLDMIDGGGEGRAGQRFEGGGLLSDIGNAMFRPYGFEERMGQVRPQARPMQPPMQAPMQQPMPPAMSPFERFGGQAPAAYSPSMGGGRTAVGPQPLSAPMTYGPQNGRPIVGQTNTALLQQMLAELSDLRTPPERRAQIEQTLRAMPGLQGGGDILGYLGGL
jgi:hypothetical protein